MNISERLSCSSMVLDSALDRLLSESDKDNAILIDAMRYGVMSGGKRIRPFLTLEFCNLFGGDMESSLYYACAVEMVHSYSLIHDDLPAMDNDDIRRGKPSCHIEYGEANALLAGDALLTYAFEVCVKNKRQTAETNCNAVRLLSNAAGSFGMIGGQVLDLYGDTHLLDFDTLIKLQSLKTGALIKAAVSLGCISAGVKETDERYKDALLYASNIGLAFQIIDDILDAREDTEIQEKTTFIRYMNVEEAFDYARKLTDEAIAAISKYGNSSTLIELALFLLNRTY